ncbi:FhaA domain-containing protein [Rothia nasimurium]|uniref:FhaA domain-containing protein n=1 Tax=Rothia nasimurium TaxID=85336 RepID=UPI001F185CF6|nr:DUF3662 and FHA domain-containing protein [Rothia nasimurium]
MGFINRLEQGLEKAVRSTFSKSGTFEPVDIANRIRTEMDDKAYAVASGRTLAPNVFTVEFSAPDFHRAQQWGVPLAEELCDVVVRHGRAQGYSLRGTVRVTFAVAHDLEPGDFIVTGSLVKLQGPEDAAAPAPYAPAAGGHPGSATDSLPTRITRPARPAAAPAPPYQAPQQPKPQVVLDINGERVMVRSLPVTLGRGSNADITLDDSGVSRRHLEIVEQDGTYLAVDLGSTNGSYVNGQRLHGRAEIKSGTVLEMGSARIVFRLMVRKG